MHLGFGGKKQNWVKPMKAIINFAHKYLSLKRPYVILNKKRDLLIVKVPHQRALYTTLQG